MHDMLRLRRMSLGLCKRLLPLASVVGTGLCLIETPTTCRAEQLDQLPATKSVEATAPPICAAGMLPWEVEPGPSRTQVSGGQRTRRWTASASSPNGETSSTMSETRSVL